jgi:MFS family permease
MFDLAVVNVAFPDILSDLEITRSDGSWMVSLYSIFFGSLLLVAGTTADSVDLRNAELIFSNWSNTTYLGRQSISRSRRCR